MAQTHQEEEVEAVPARPQLPPLDHVLGPHRRGSAAGKAFTDVHELDKALALGVKGHDIQKGLWRM